MKCIYCAHPYTYILGDQQRKCSKCKRKFSPRKIKREEKLYSLFTQGLTARETSRQTGMHFATVEKRYRQFRRDIALQSDRQYQLNSHRITGYEEYLYLPKSLKAEKHIDKLQQFLTLSYDGKVYNLMMPTVSTRYVDSENDQENKLLLKYLNFSKISKISKAHSTITEFWDYFESFILQYKGISNEQFVFYLKEAEWRFNSGRK